MDRRGWHFCQETMVRLKDALTANGNETSEVETWGQAHISAGIRLRVRTVKESLIHASLLYLPMPAGKLVMATRFSKRFKAPNYSQAMIQIGGKKEESFFTIDDDPEAFSTAQTIRGEINSIIVPELKTEMDKKNFWSNAGENSELRLIADLGYNSGAHFGVEDMKKAETEWLKAKKR